MPLFRPLIDRGRNLASAITMLAVVSTLAGCDRPSGTAGAGDEAAPYEYRASQSPDGTGKFYMGREIAQFGEISPEWLERPKRETEELPGRVIRALELRPTDVLADIGAGTGYFTFRISPMVPAGRVFAVDIQQEMLDIISERADRIGAFNVTPVLGTVTDPNLPADSVDVALVVFTYSQLSHPFEMMANIGEALKPGGRLILVEYRGEDPTIPVAEVYKISEEQARRELDAVGLQWRETRDFLPQQHFMVFEKPMDGG